MKGGMETLQDLVEELKLRTVYWALCVFAVSYFLTHTSKSMWMNVPISVLLVCGLRILFNEVEFHWTARNIRRKTYLSHLEKKQISVNDSRLSTLPPPPKWKRKIDSPVVEAAMEDFVKKLVQDFVKDLWYSDITPDKEAPELIHAIVMDILAEVSGRVKEINLVDLLTRDLVDLVGDHLDLFRRNQAAIGVDVMGTLSSEERDERLKHHLRDSKELHPALISPECEYKVLQRLIGGVLAVALRPREAQCPLVRCIARELLTCLVMQPVINLASPGYINELIEYIFLATNNEGVKQAGVNLSSSVDGHKRGHVVSADNHQHDDAATGRSVSSQNQGTYLTLSNYNNKRKVSCDVSPDSVSNLGHDEALLHRSAEWARVFDAANQRRTEVLMPENLENMWTKGRNYKKKVQKISATGVPPPITKTGVLPPITKGSGISSSSPTKNSDKEILEAGTRVQYKASAQTPPRPPPDSQPTDVSQDLHKAASFMGSYEFEDTSPLIASGNKVKLKRSNSTSDLINQANTGISFTSQSSGPIISEFYSANLGGHNQVTNIKSSSDMVLSNEGQHVSKLKCRVLGAYFEKLGSKSFAVYSIAVTDADSSTWFVKRRYRNFERLHRQLKEIPNYTLHLPPKRIFSSSTEDTFVHQRCIQLDKYLQDLLSIANVAEQHEVCDFLSDSSKNYSFEKSPSVMRTLAVNVDDAVDDIVRQFKGVSDGLMRKVVGASPSTYEPSSSICGSTLSWKEDEINKLILRQHTGSTNNFSDYEEGDKGGSGETGSNAQANGWHSDNELNSKEFPPRVVKHSPEVGGLDSKERWKSRVQSESISNRGMLGANSPVMSERLEDPTGVPPEWSPPNLSVPVLNLVDTIFQLKRRGWLRRQVFWISKQILQLMMEDAIDDWLLRQIHWLRRDDIIAQGIRWIQDVLWPDGTFFLRLNTKIETDHCKSYDRSSQSTSHSASSQVPKPGSFELQLEAARRASDVKKFILNGAPTTLVSLIGHNQYKRCAKDIYYFLQSTICLKQLTYGILELLLVSVFPELREVILDVHEKMRSQPV